MIPPLPIPSAPVSGWREDLGILIAERDPARSEEMLARILEAAPAWHEVRDAIREMRFPEPTVRGDVAMSSLEYMDGRVRPYAVYVPSGYDPARAVPAIVYLHGSVTRDEIRSNPREYARRNPLRPLAEKQGWLLVTPFGQKGATWWDEIGMRGVRDILREVKRMYNVDDDRVYMGGFSDGASGAYTFAMTDPVDYAGFFCFNGHMGIGGIDGEQSLYAPNLANKPIRAVSTDLDPLYPASEARQTIEMAASAGAEIDFHQYEGIGHQFTYASEESPVIRAFIEMHQRSRYPRSIQWETANADHGRCGWIHIDRIAPVGAAPWHTDYNMVLTDDRVSFGLFSDDSFAGQGVRVQSLVEGKTLARSLSIRPGDIIAACNESRIDSVDDLIGFKAGIKRGDPINVTVTRGGEERRLYGRVPDPEHLFLFGRRAPSAAVRARYADNRFELESSRLGACTLRLLPESVRLEEEVVVEGDGRVLFRGRVEPDLALLVRNFLEERDRSLLYVAALRVSLESATR
jgi:predicted esterase